MVEETDEAILQRTDRGEETARAESIPSRRVTPDCLMSLSRRRALVIAVVGVALVTNGAWLFPSEGEPRYTYERSAVTVENERITYEGREAFRQYNGLSAVGCQAVDTDGRVCAFEAYLAEHGPVNVSKRGFNHLRDDRAEFVELDGGYYHRVRRSVDDGTLAYDAEAVEPSTLLAEISREVTTSGEGAFLGTRVAASGAETSPAGPESVRGVGSVYEVDGTYYAVVVAERSPVDRVPVPIPRLPLAGVGIAALAWLGVGFGRERIEGLRDGE